MLEDLRSKIERHNGKFGKKWIQKHDAVKISYILHLLTKIEVAGWTKCMLKELKVKLGSNVMLTLVVAKINDGKAFKEGICIRKKVLTQKKKVRNMGVHVETIKSQQL